MPEEFIKYFIYDSGILNLIIVRIALWNYLRIQESTMSFPMEIITDKDDLWRTDASIQIDEICEFWKQLDNICM